MIVENFYLEVEIREKLMKEERETRMNIYKMIFLVVGTAGWVYLKKYINPRFKSVEL